MSIKTRRLLFLALSAAIMILIFWFSGRTGAVSQSQSDAFLPVFLRFLPKSIASFVIRKGAHFTIYAALGFCLYAGIETLCPPLPAALFSLLIAVLYAASDEWHQLFVPGRSGELRDVLLDGCGALCGILACMLLIVLIRRLCAKKSAGK